MGEEQYLELVQKVLNEGHIKGDRTGTGTISIFGYQMRFDLQKGFPLLTTKKMFWKGIVEELLWIIRGETNIRSLVEKNIHIWDANATRQALDARGLDYPEGELGHIYGYQWRHWGNDQLKEVIRQLKEEPTSRRIIISSWNVVDIPKMALPPCHILVQFYVSDGKLSCQLYQRSGDIGLGVPFNIASYALLTQILAHHTGYIASEFIHVLGDAHIYINHIETLKEQVKRVPYLLPKVHITAPIDKEIWNYTIDDFELIDYNYHSSLKMDMSV